MIWLFFYDVQQWSYWLGQLTFNMLQYASFTQEAGSIMSFVVIGQERVDAV